MDEACLNVGKITDITLLEEMDRKLKGHKHYSSRRWVVVWAVALSIVPLPLSLTI